MKALQTAATVLMMMAGMVCVERAAGQAKRPPQKKQTGEQAPKADSSRALLQQAAEAIKAEKFAEAVEPLAEYLKQHPEDAEVHFQLGYVYSELGKRDEARVEYERAIALDGKLTEAHVNLGLLLLEKEPGRAVEAFRAAAELQPEKARPRYLLGRALEAAENPTGALEAFRAAAEKDPKSFDARFAVARMELRQNEAAKAEEDYRKALELKADSPEARLGLAESLLRQEKWEAAARELEGYLKAKPEDGAVRMARATALVELGRDDEALSELAVADKQGALNAAGFQLAAQALVRKKDWDAAAGALQRAIALEPGSAYLHGRLGRIFLEKRAFAPAERELRQALAIDATLTEARKDLMSTLYLSEKYEAALATMDEIEKLETPNTLWWFLRATCYDKLGRIKEALAAYEKFMALDQGRNQNQNFQAEARIRILKKELERRR